MRFGVRGLGCRVQGLGFEVESWDRRFCDVQLGIERAWGGLGFRVSVSRGVYRVKMGLEYVFT